jgi:hypothetical protein
MVVRWEGTVLTTGQSYEKWHDNYYAMRDHALETLPYPMRILVGLLVYRKAMGALHGQGAGRLTGEERRAFQREGWESIEAQLVASKKKAAASDAVFWILGGEHPTEADATLYGFIVAAQVSTA